MITERVEEPVKPEVAAPPMTMSPEAMPETARLVVVARVAQISPDCRLMVG